MSPGLGRLIRIIALAFAILFTVAAGAQYWFLTYQLNRETKEDLIDSAQQVENAVDYRQSWDLAGYRRVTNIPDSYILQAASGTLIETIDFTPGLISRVSIPFDYHSDEPFSAPSDVGESWTLDVHPLKDGLVIVGARNEALPSDIETRLRANALRFGTTVKDAVAAKERGIEELLDFAVIDTKGNLLRSSSELPLKADPPKIPASPTFLMSNELGGKLYAELHYPIFDQAGHGVALVNTFEDITNQEEMLGRVGRFNAAVCAGVWLVAVSLIFIYLRRISASQVSCSEIPMLDESDRIEFKASLRWDFATQRANKELENQVVRAVVGFMNTETGGTVALGVTDNKQVYGLEPDYSTLKGRKDRDGFEQIFRQILVNAIGERRARYVRVDFCKLQGKEICMLRVPPAPEPTFLEETGGKTTMYLRVGNTTRALNTKEACEYVSERWGGPKLRLPWRRAALSLGV